MPLPSSGTGNTTNNPLFADAMTGDYRLQANSPCINMGATVAELDAIYETIYANPWERWWWEDIMNTDLDGNPRIVGGREDMGAYEFTGSEVGEADSVPVKIPFDWLDEYRGWNAIYGYVDLALANGANGITFWQSYVAGLIPTNAGSLFLTTNITLNAEGGIVLKWSPDLPDRKYKVWGKTNLMDGGWHFPTNSGTRFFKVTVGLDGQ